ncbi:MAG: HAD-IA family hydrolase [Candidatus Coatesbacteria bacterium]|nr:MAG: HAD-IA family hydrolase [Candidatus Coatesbacteria bacterium]
MPRALFFDLDNTLYDHRRAAREALAEVYRRYDVGATGTAVDEFARLFFEINQRLWLGLAGGEIDVTTLRDQRFAELFARVGVAAPFEAPVVGREYLAVYLERSYPLPGAEEVLAALAPLLPLGLLTNGFTDIQRPKIARLGWDPYFTWVAVAEELGVFKPDAAIYAQICRMAEASPAEIIYVGDSPVEDVMAARQVGLRTVWVRREGPEVARWAAEAQADYEVADVRDVAPLVRSLVGVA